jgi:hypothetical protein
VIDEDIFKNEETLPTEIVNSVLNVYNECAHIPASTMKNNVNVTGQIDGLK